MHASLQDWLLLRCFESAEVIKRDSTSTEQTQNSAMDLDGEQTRALMLLGFI